MALTKTPVCDFGKKAEDFKLKSIENKIISLVVILIMFWPIMSTGSLIKNWYGVITFFIIGLCMSLSKFRNSDYS